MLGGRGCGGKAGFLSSRACYPLALTVVSSLSVKCICIFFLFLSPQAKRKRRVQNLFMGRWRGRGASWAAESRVRRCGRCSDELLQSGLLASFLKLGSSRKVRVSVTQPGKDKQGIVRSRSSETGMSNPFQMCFCAVEMFPSEVYSVGNCHVQVRLLAARSQSANQSTSH